MEIVERPWRVVGFRREDMVRKNPYDKFKDERLEDKKIKEYVKEKPKYDENVVRFIENIYDANAGGIPNSPKVVNRLKGIKYGPYEVEEFSRWLEYRQKDGPDWSSGRYMEALVKCMEGEEVTLHTKEYDKEIDALGHHMGSKSITVDGDVGGHLGHRMYGGRVSVFGDAGDFVGSDMRGGEITIHGNVKGVGVRMKGGKVTIKGNATNVCFDGFVGGEIWIEGDLPKWSDGSYKKCTPGGKVYHKGKLVFDYDPSYTKKSSKRLTRNIPENSIEKKRKN